MGLGCQRARVLHGCMMSHPGTQFCPCPALLRIRRQLWEELEESLPCVVEFLTPPSFLARLQDTAPSMAGGREAPALQSVVTQHEMAQGEELGSVALFQALLWMLSDPGQLTEPQAGTAHIHKRGSIRSHKSQGSSVTGAHFYRWGAQSHTQGVGSAQGAGVREQEEQDATRPESRLDR